MDSFNYKENYNISKTVSELRSTFFYLIFLCNQSTCKNAYSAMLHRSDSPTTPPLHREKLLEDRTLYTFQTAGFIDGGLVIELYAAGGRHAVAILVNKLCVERAEGREDGEDGKVLVHAMHPKVIPSRERPTLGWLEVSVCILERPKDCGEGKVDGKEPNEDFRMFHHMVGFG